MRQYFYSRALILRCWTSYCSTMVKIRSSRSLRRSLMKLSELNISPVPSDILAKVGCYYFGFKLVYHDQWSWKPRLLSIMLFLSFLSFFSVFSSNKDAGYSYYASQSGCRLNDLSVIRCHSDAAFLTITTCTGTLFHLLLFFVYFVASINKVEPEVYFYAISWGKNLVLARVSYL